MPANCMTLLQRRAGCMILCNNTGLTCKVHHRVLHFKCDVLDLTGQSKEQDLSGGLYPTDCLKGRCPPYIILPAHIFQCSDD